MRVTGMPGKTPALCPLPEDGLSQRPYRRPPSRYRDMQELLPGMTGETGPSQIPLLTGIVGVRCGQMRLN